MKNFAMFCMMLAIITALVASGYILTRPPEILFADFDPPRGYVLKPVAGMVQSCSFMDTKGRTLVWRPHISNECWSRDAYGYPKTGEIAVTLKSGEFNAH